MPLFFVDADSLLLDGSLFIGSYSKQIGHEGDLPGDISCAQPSDLSLAEEVHYLLSLQRSPGRFNT